MITWIAPVVLMFAALMLLLLINATYQDGNAERRPAGERDRWKRLFCLCRLSSSLQLPPVPG